MAAYGLEVVARGRAAGFLGLLAPAPASIPLADVQPAHEITRALDRAMDGIRDRFGSGSLTRGVLLGRDTGFTMPGLPD